VWKTRDDVLAEAVSALQPDFDARAPVVPGITETLPNPLVAYRAALDLAFDGTLSRLHGDLHLANILVGHNSSAFLIDFSRARLGHTAYDWAVLFTSLLCDVVALIIEPDWPVVRLVAHRAVDHPAALHNQGEPPPYSPEAAEWLGVLSTVRGIVSELLAEPGQWGEFWASVALVAMRAMTWAERPIGTRRLMFALSAVSFDVVFSRAGRLAGRSTSDATDVFPDGLSQ
jgi:hypothetical protein